jgi:pyruvate ferredoxin oxidoreductase beta subunit/2-oxoisovalerate ferredoxin oxidoreductase beta subunit
MKDTEYHEEGQFCSGHNACAGCAEALSMRVVLNAVGENAVGVVVPSCVAIIIGGHPRSSAKIPFIHGLLESAAAMASGVKRGLVSQGKDDTTVICMAGDGGTYDIGLQALSSAAERNEDILYICYDNEGYMNTGGQTSSSTPMAASTGSTPMGKTTRKKNLVEILAAHRIPYIATASPSHLNDLSAKVTKAKGIRGMKVIIVVIPCLPGWGIADDAVAKVSRLAVESGVFPLIEVEDGVRYSFTIGEKTKPIDEYLDLQKRYRHISDSERVELQQDVDESWDKLVARTKM